MKADNMKVRRADGDDAERIMFVINSTNAEYFKDIIPPGHFRSPVLDEVQVIDLMNRMSFIVSEHDGNIVGVAACDECEPGVIEVSWVYVLVGFQRRGIGTRMVSDIEEEARRRNLTTARLATPEGALWAIQFYESLGYIVTGRRRNPWGFDVVLKKQLD